MLTYRFLKIVFLFLFICDICISQNTLIGFYNENNQKVTSLSYYNKSTPYTLCAHTCYKFFFEFNEDSNYKIFDTTVWHVVTDNNYYTSEREFYVCLTDTASLYYLNYYTVRVGSSITPYDTPISEWGMGGFYFNVRHCSPYASFLQDVHTICPDEVIHFSDSSFRGPDRWLWTFDGGLPQTWDGQDPPEVKYSSPGTYEVSLQVYNDHGGDTLVKQSTVYVTTGPQQVSSSEASHTGLAGETVTLEACSVGDTYEWIPSEGLSCDDCRSPTLTYGTIDRYICVVSTRESGCRDSCEVEVRTQSRRPSVTFPNVFTPNYDGVNDVFEGSWQFAEPVELRIFDRWGGCMYSSRHRYSWDGTYRGQSVSNGVYVYYFTYRDVFTGREQMVSGDVTVMR